MLIMYSQTELSVNTHVTVVNTHTMVSGLEHKVTSAHTMVSDIHRTIVKGQEGCEDKNLSVSNTHTLSVAE